MKMPVRNCAVWVSRWAWPALLALAVLPACRRSEVECETRAFFRLVEPERKTGAAPFSIDRLGPEVKESLSIRPYYVTLKEGNHAEVGWMGFDLGLDVDYIYSPEEGVARNALNADDVLPMKRLSDERLLVGFRSLICVDGIARSHYCMDDRYSKEELPFAADMTCRRPWVWEDP